VGGELRFSEFFSHGAGLTTSLDALLHCEHSGIQHICVVQSPVFGRMLLLDGMVMLTEWDEFIYHEMLVHPALFLLPFPRKVLVIGGGDGGTVREVLRHPSIEHVDLVEIDPRVIAVAQSYFPTVAAGFSDPRVHLHHADGAEFVRSAPSGFYDAVFVDSTDPTGIAESLFGEAFYSECQRVLHATGVLALQSESPLHPVYCQTLPRVHRLLRPLFRHVASYLASIPTYPTGMWSFTLASRHYHPLEDFSPTDAQQRIERLSGKLRYYTAELHRAAFALPGFVQELISEGLAQPAP